MHHPGHDDGCPKCRINLRQIAALAPLLAEHSDAALELAMTADAAVSMFDALGTKDGAPPQGPCEHAVKLMAWIRDPEKADDELMRQWTAEILDDIEALIGVDAHHGEGG